MAMRRKWRSETKVWHDPNVVLRGKRSSAEPPTESATEAEPTNGGRTRRPAPARHDGARIAARANGVAADPREAERERLLGKLLHADGHIAVSQAAKAYTAASFEFPKLQEVWLQLLEHSDEDTVIRALAELGELLQQQPPSRRAVLDSRLRRIEELADEEATRSAAARLRRMISHRWAVDSSPGITPPS